MKIRHAEPEDAEEIHGVALNSWKDTYSYILSEDAIEEVIDEWYSIEGLRNQTKDPIFYVAEESGKVVGFVHATLEDGEATLHRIYLDPDYQSQGIGSRLYETAEEDIKEEADRIELEVLAENEKGNSFYQKQGYREQEVGKTDLKGEKVKQKILVKEIDRSD